MPRKNRCTALAVVFALLVCLAGQAAAVAMPFAGPRAAVNHTAAGDLVGAVWAWLASQWADLGNVVASPARPGLTAVEKVGSGGDPNGGGHRTHIGIRGEGL
jgi:hypothetical protein